MMNFNQQGNPNEAMPKPTNVPETLQEGEKNKEAEAPEPTAEEQLANVEAEEQTKVEQIAQVNEFIKETEEQLKEVRTDMGLPTDAEDPPSILSSEDTLEKLTKDKEALQKQKEELITKQEREKWVQEEKKKILQEKLDSLFKLFEGMNIGDLASLAKNGKTKDGKNFNSPDMGQLDAETIKALANAFQQGLKMLPEILGKLPELLNKFDQELEKEANRRIDKKLKEEKEKLPENEPAVETKKEEPEATTEPAQENIEPAPVAEQDQNKSVDFQI